ncbi:hypothetical protein FB451DRAFT_1421267 [Mycena latifolia]|nr:hypothetical protein FB451DRAFT_1421267 [Mycena latifolia]
MDYSFFGQRLTPGATRIRGRPRLREPPARLTFDPERALHRQRQVEADTTARLWCSRSLPIPMYEGGTWEETWQTTFGGLVDRDAGDETAATPSSATTAAASHSPIEDIEKDWASIMRQVNDLRTQLSPPKDEDERIEEQGARKKGSERGDNGRLDLTAPLENAFDVFAEQWARTQAGESDEQAVQASIGEKDDEDDPAWAYAGPEVYGRERLQQARVRFTPMSPEASKWYPRLARRRAKFETAVEAAVREGSEVPNWADYSSHGYVDL